MSAPVHSASINAYFAMNFVAASAGGFEVNLKEITYIAEGGGIYTASMPDFPGNILNNPGVARTGLPDIDGLTGLPTYTNGGDGESARTINESVAIHWDMGGAFPSLEILSIRLDAPDLKGERTAEFEVPYTVGLIPLGPDTELDSSLPGRRRIFTTRWQEPPLQLRHLRLSPPYPLIHLYSAPLPFPLPQRCPSRPRSGCWGSA